MAKLILAYNFQGDRLRQLKLVCMMINSKLRVIDRADMNQPLAYLVGVPGAEQEYDFYTGDGCKKEMLVFYGFKNRDLDSALNTIRTSQLKRVELKAVFTMNNAFWSGVQLQCQLVEEHEFMKGRTGKITSLHEEEEKQKLEQQKAEQKIEE